MEILILFGTIGLFVLAAVLAFNHEWKKAEAREEAERKELETKLAEEKLKPMARITFELSDGTLKHTEPFEPTIIMDRVISSHDFSAKILYKFYEIGRFRDEEMITYPACNIKRAWLEKVDK